MGVESTPSTGGRGVTPSTGGRGVTPSTGGRAQDPGAVLPNLGAGLVFPTYALAAGSAPALVAGSTPATILFASSGARPAGLPQVRTSVPSAVALRCFISAARLTNVPVLCARRAISSQSSAQGQVNRSVHHHHRSESREVF